MKTDIYRPRNAVRFVTAASLFDGHDAAINLFRRLLQSSGAEVIHLGHSRSVEEIVTCAIQEDVQGIAVSSYQGGHMEFFRYMIDLLKERGCGHIKVFGGGGGTITTDEIAALEAYGITKIYTPEDGMRLGLQGIINHMMREADFPVADLDVGGGLQERAKKVFDQMRGEGWPAVKMPILQRLDKERSLAVARAISVAEITPNPSFRKVGDKSFPSRFGRGGEERAGVGRFPVIGITGTGGAGKSTLTDELLRRFIAAYPDKTFAVISVDPTRRKTGGALLGDRIRMNQAQHPHVYMRSMATRGAKSEIPEALPEAVKILRSSGYNLIFVETPGIGQGDSAISELVDVSIYVMTAEFGAPSQLEKIDMLDFADLVVINKFDRRGSEDALRDVRKQYQRNHKRFDETPDQMPVFGTVASRFNDPGTDRLAAALIETIVQKLNLDFDVPTFPNTDAAPAKIIPGERVGYLGEIVTTVRNYRKAVDAQAVAASSLYRLHGAKEILATTGKSAFDIDSAIADIEVHLSTRSDNVLGKYADYFELYSKDELITRSRDTELRQSLVTRSISGTRIPKIALPRFEDWGDQLRWLKLENVPGEFPFTNGVFALRRQGEDPKRQFAGIGTPERTNRRFHYLSESDTAKRLSTAFDPVTLYGDDPDERPDIFGRVGESGVNVCTLDDVKKLYAGFDLCAPNTSVSITINGPAPMILAMFLNTAIDQQIEKFEREKGRTATDDERAQIKAQALQSVRGTVQADILKEDQAQNECIFTTEFSLRMMGDIQQFFVDNKIRNYYSVSISGFHIAEAGANPISQLAFTLANAFTYVEYYLARGMQIDDFAPNLSFFFSNGMDPEYAVIGRVARRIWAVTMREKYGASERSQKLKYHIQTSGRSLHAQEIQFNDIRTTLQAILALEDNCNSLHTNAYDEAITTPTEESLRRAMAVQLIITQEFGMQKCENLLSGSFAIEQLTELVEEAVLQEFTRINDRGGVLGAMETQYQRGKIQDESLIYEQLKHSGEMPIVGVNTYVDPNAHAALPRIDLERASTAEKQQQVDNLRAFQSAHAETAPMMLDRLKSVATSGGNIFAELMETVRHCSLGQITKALYEVGGQYRRNV